MVARKAVAFCGCGAFGLLSLIVGAVLIHVFDQLVHSEVEKNVPLVNGSDAYKNWQKPPPILFQVWVFDIVNYEEVMKGEKPYLVEMGPYTYRQYVEKFDIDYTVNDTVFYRQNQTYVFDRSLSVGSENDTFHTVNIPMLTVMDMLQYENGFIKTLVQKSFTSLGEHLFLNLTVYELLWGYEDTFLKDVDEIIKPFTNKTFPKIFGLFSGENGTDTGLYQIYSGIEDVTKIGEIVTWNGESSLPYWNSEIANAINGSDATIYPPFSERDATKYFYSVELCRSLGLEYAAAVETEDISMNRYMTTEQTLGNISINPYNAGFCSPPGNCMPSGLLNISVCKEGAPIVMSMPHFLSCEPQTKNAVRGLHPDKSQHSSYIDIEPMTGVVMNAAKKLQINVYMDEIDGFSETQHLSSLVMPVIWLNQTGHISSSDASKFRSALPNKIKLLDGVKYCLIALGGLILAVLLALLVKSKLFGNRGNGPLKINASDDDDPLIT